LKQNKAFMFYQAATFYQIRGACFSVQPWASAHGLDGELKLGAAR
jgi:hypothetical protein